jgi:hypothetical protein
VLCYCNFYGEIDQKEWNFNVVIKKVMQTVLGVGIMFSQVEFSELRSID